MSETARSVIFDALQEILVQDSEQPLLDTDFQSGVRYLNRMMATIPFNRLGYRKVVNPSDIITVDDQAIDGIVSNLAKRLAPQYDITVNQSLLMDARSGLLSIRKLTSQLKPMQYPSTLPIGSGNEDRFTGDFDQHFYEPESIPFDAEPLTIGEVNNLSYDFVNYLDPNATINSFTISSNDKVAESNAAINNTAIDYTVTGVNQGYGKVCITITTSTGRINTVTIDFDVKASCNA